MADEEERKEEGAEDKKPKKKSGMGLLIGIIVAMLVIQAVLAFAVVIVTAPKSEDPVTEQPTDTTTAGDISNAAVANEQIVPTTFTHVVNIAGTDGMRFLKVSIQLAFDMEKNKNFLTEAVKYETPIKNYINQYLASLSLEEVQDRNVQQNVRRDILRGINKLFPPNSGEISNVYITEFLIQ